VEKSFTFLSTIYLYMLCYALSIYYSLSFKILPICRYQFPWYPYHRLRITITIDTTIHGFLSAQIGVAVVFIFQKFHYGCLTSDLFQFGFLLTTKRQTTRKIWQAKNWRVWYHLYSENLWLSLIEFRFSAVKSAYSPQNSFGGAGGSGRKNYVEIFGLLHL
jgi:hypothetical protein